MEPDAHTDQLAVCAARGDRAAFTALVEATCGEIQAFVAARAAHLSMVDEVVQATYVAAFESIATYRPGSSVEAWLKGIARHRLLEELRRCRRGQAGLAAAAVVAVAEPDGDPDGHRDRLAACLERLPAAWRRIIADRYWQDQPVQDIADRLGTSPGTVSQTLYRARQALLGCLGHG